MAPELSSKSFTVTGMTCEHCVASVTEELSEVPGVEAVDVDLSTGLVTVSASAEVADADLRAAIAEAGYQVS